MYGLDSSLNECVPTGEYLNPLMTNGFPSEMVTYTGLLFSWSYPTQFVEQMVVLSMIGDAVKLIFL